MLLMMAAPSSILLFFSSSFFFVSFHFSARKPNSFIRFVMCWILSDVKRHGVWVCHSRDITEMNMNFLLNEGTFGAVSCLQNWPSKCKLLSIFYGMSGKMTPEYRIRIICFGKLTTSPFLTFSFRDMLKKQSKKIELENHSCS